MIARRRRRRTTHCEVGTCLWGMAKAHVAAYQHTTIVGNEPNKSCRAIMALDGVWEREMLQLGASPLRNKEGTMFMQAGRAYAACARSTGVDDMLGHDGAYSHHLTEVSVGGSASGSI